MIKGAQQLALTVFLIVILSCNRESRELDHTLIINVNVVPMTDEIIFENQTVLIAGSKIVLIGVYHEMDIPRGTRIIDAENAYLIPGLCDMHAHVPTDIHGNLLYKSFDLFLANGVTFIRNMWGTQAILDYRNRIEAGDIPGPEIYTTGPLIDGFESQHENSRVITDSATVEEAIREMTNSGYDAIKVYDNLTPEVYFSIVNAAEELNIAVVGHVPLSVGLEDVLESGQRSIEHFRGYSSFYQDDEIISKTVDSGIWNCPTLVVKYTLSNIQELISSDTIASSYIPQEVLDYWNGYRPRNEGDIFRSSSESEGLLLAIHQRGGRIVAGTDCGNPYVVPGFSLHQELELMYEAGLTPYEALLTATRNAAELAGLDERLGTIEVGKDADLVILEGNPLEDISNTASIIGLFVKGTWYSQGDLNSILEGLRQ